MINSILTVAITYMEQLSIPITDVSPQAAQAAARGRHLGFAVLC